MGNDLDELALEYMAKALCCMAGNEPDSLWFTRAGTVNQTAHENWEKYTDAAEAQIQIIENEAIALLDSIKEQTSE